MRTAEKLSVAASAWLLLAPLLLAPLLLQIMVGMFALALTVEFLVRL